MVSCGTLGCACTTCEKCGRAHSECLCELIEDTNRLLDKDDYTYEDFAHSSRYLLQKWVSAIG